MREGSGFFVLGNLDVKLLTELSCEMILGGCATV